MSLNSLAGMLSSMASDTMADNQPLSSTEVTYEWSDITADFLAACEDLQLGELLHDSSFGLFEAMSAIEMMDPKMDAGMVCNQAQRPVYNLQRGIQANVVKVKDISHKEMIGIIDDTLACVVTWLEGHSLAQTVFTNLYLHDPTLIEDRALRAFCLAVLRIVDRARDSINRACVFEEEDFQPMTYGFKMAFDVADGKIISMLREAEEELNRVVKTTRVKAGEERDASTEEEHDLAVAVHSRLRFCRLFLALQLALDKEKCQGMSEVQKLLNQTTELFPQLSKSQELGTQPGDSVASPCDYPTIMGFEPLVNQRLLPPTFPRYTKIQGRAQALQYFEDLVDNLKVVCKVTEISDLHALLEFFHEFSTSCPCVFSRSMLQLVFLSQNRRVFGSIAMIDALRDTIRTFILPPVLMNRGPLANNSQAKEYVDAFLTHAGRPMTSLFQISGNNRARQRDKWGHLLEDLASLQEEANKVDAFVHRQLSQLDPATQYTANLATWVLYHTLHVMIHFTLAGFELELYAVHEYHYVYWYLYECLYRWQISTLTRTNDFYQSHHDFQNEQQQKGRSNKKKDKKNKKRVRPHARETVLTQAAQQLAGGYYKAVVGLQLAGKLQTPTFEFDSEEVRYNHRFAPFGALITPPAVQYAQFKDMTDLSKYEPAVTPEDLYQSSCDCFQQARTYYETVLNPSPEVQTLLKITKTNFVVIKLLLGGHKKDSKDPPEFDFSLHKIFPLIKIT